MRVLILLLLVVSPVYAGKDQHGFDFDLSLWAEDRLVVVTFLGAECPLGKFYAARLNELHSRYPDIRFVAVNSNEGDSYEEMVEFGRLLNFPIVKDTGNVWADELKATRSPETFLLNHHQVVYQGRIDDQYEPGVHTRTVKRRHLEEAIKEAIVGQPISVSKTEPVGCHIDRVEVKPSVGKVTWQHVAPIFYRKCVECHRPGQSAPFSLLTYEDAVGWTETIRDVLNDGRMPPWGADPKYGHFANDRSLTKEERLTLFQWLDEGTPNGKASPPPIFASDWNIVPDLVLTAPEFTVPAEGLLDYQNFIIDPGLNENTWVEAVEVKPGNRAVVHHATIYLQPKGAKPDVMYSPRDDEFLYGYLPGNSVLKLPPGHAKCIPAGWDLRLLVHYTPNGEEQRDQTQVGLRLAKQQPTHQVASKLLMVRGFELQPGEVRTLVKEHKLTQDWTLLSLTPHMHLRGRSMLFEAIYPDHAEVLLNVPDYDFEWQHAYVLAEPKAIPKGTILRCTAVYDNSANNKRNPDPTVIVREGERTEDEMFVGGFQMARPLPKQSYTLPIVGVVIGLLFLLLRGRHVAFDAPA